MIPEQQMLSHTGCTLSELADAAIALLREHEPPEGYYGCFSGGKDSVVIKELARIAGVRVDWNYNVTTADPPELTRFIKEHHPDVAWNRSKRRPAAYSRRWSNADILRDAFVGAAQSTKRITEITGEKSSVSGRTNHLGELNSGMR
jgi:hypothetical protein